MVPLFTLHQVLNRVALFLSRSGSLYGSPACKDVGWLGSHLFNRGRI